MAPTPVTARAGKSVNETAVPRELENEEEGELYIRVSDEGMEERKRLAIG